MFSQTLIRFARSNPTIYQLARTASELASWKLTNPGIQPAANLLFNLVLGGNDAPYGKSEMT
jgi:hypothetical protein